MRENEVTKFLVSFSGQIEHVRFPGGVFDGEMYIQYEFVWGPDWEVMSGLTTGLSQRSRPGSDPEIVVFNMPIELVFSSTNISGWPQLVLTVRSGAGSLRGYALVLAPSCAGARRSAAPLLRPRAASPAAEWLAWLTGRYPELHDATMLANGRDNYLLRTESYGAVSVSLSMISKDLRRLGYDNEPPPPSHNVVAS